jgi:hypothetical protein
MKISTKEYVDNQISWVRSLKQMENEWLEKHLETKWKTEEEARKVYNELMTTWKREHDEWKDRVEAMVAQMITRREMKANVVTALTIMIMFLGLLVAIFLKK